MSQSVDDDLGVPEGSEPAEKSRHVTFAEALPEFRVAVRPDGSDVWVDAKGEIDIYTSPRLKEAITHALGLHPRNLYVDMSLVSFIDSSTISVLAAANQLAESESARLIIHAPARVVRRTLTLAGLIDHLNVED
jgi:anti-sigma B factor antagonist